MKLEISVAGRWVMADMNQALAQNVYRNLRNSILAGSREMYVVYEANYMQWRMVY